MILLDHNAGAPLRPEIAAHLAVALSEVTGNPSSIHQLGRAARKRLDTARQTIASLVGASSPREVVFTGSGSEAAALAIIGTWLGRADTKKTVVVTSDIEHPSVLGAVARVESLGGRVVRLKPNAHGVISADELIDSLTPEVALCSLMWVNNETGVIQPVERVSRACVERGIPFHTDAVQAFGRLPATLREVPADLVSLTAHKLGGPAGVGALIARRSLEVAALIPGHQENGRRGGTLSVAMAEALAMALATAIGELETEPNRQAQLRSEFERRVLGALPDTRVTGFEAPRVCNTSNLCFPGADGEGLLIALDLEGICVSTGAACASGSLSPSHVLKAMGVRPADIQGTLRFSIGKGTTGQDIEQAVEALTRLVPTIRST